MLSKPNTTKKKILKVRNKYHIDNVSLKDLDEVLGEVDEI